MLYAEESLRISSKYKLHTVLNTTLLPQMVFWFVLSPWLIGTVRAEPESVISRAWVQSPDPAE